MQQACLLLFFNGVSLRQIAKRNLLSRSTVSRWIKRLKEQFELHGFYLKSCLPILGYYSSFAQFWKNCLNQIPLAKTMLMLNKLGVIIP